MKLLAFAFFCVLLSASAWADLSPTALALKDACIKAHHKQYSSEKISYKGLVEHFTKGSLSSENCEALAQISETVTKIKNPSYQLDDLAPLQFFTNLEELELHASRASNFRPLAKLTKLKVLKILGSSRPTDISFLASMKELKELALVDLDPNDSDWDLSYIAALDKLESLDLSKDFLISDISGFSGKLKNLKTLNINETSISDISVLAEFTGLADLSLPSSVKDISGIAGLSNLQSLTLYDTEVPLQQILNLKSAQNLTSLEINWKTRGAFDVNEPARPADISALKGLASLKKLVLFDSLATDVSFLASLTNLEDLRISYSDISDIGPLSSLKNLKYLDLGNTKVKSIEPLKGLSLLKRIYLLYSEIEDLNPLKGLIDLEYLAVSGNKICSFDALEELEKEHLNSLGKTVRLTVETGYQNCQAVKSDQ